MRWQLLPAITDKAEYRALYRDTSTWLPAMKAICVRHGLDVSKLRREPLGTHIVFRVGSFIVKLFCTLWSDDFASERAVLQHLRGLPVPKLITCGELDGWPYIITTALPGGPVTDVWDRLDTAEKGSILEHLGGFMRALHDHPPVPELELDWNAFLAERVKRWDRHHQAEGAWRDWIWGRVSGFCEDAFEAVLLSADITDEHVLVVDRDGRWQFSGVIDFGDAMMGHPYYDFVAPLTCLTVGEPSLSRTLLESYGMEFTPGLADRLTTYCLLHKYGRLSDILLRCPVSSGAALHEALWGDVCQRSGASFGSSSVSLCKER
jgi:hygromycin-B 7''-O-kinase